MQQPGPHQGVRMCSSDPGPLALLPCLLVPQPGAQLEAASRNQPPYITDENGMLTYQYDPEYIARNYEVFDLRVYHR